MNAATLSAGSSRQSGRGAAPGETPPASSSGADPTGTAADGLADLYASAYPRLVRVVAAMSDGAEDAESCVQDAFVRLIPRWERVRRYDDPEAWVRQVAVRQLLSRHRRRQVALRALPRLLRGDAAPEPDGTRVDVDAAMRALPVPQRAVLVLHHGLGLPLEEVAEVLGVPVGTVKSRLHRARAAFTATYEPALPEEAADA